MIYFMAEILRRLNQTGFSGYKQQKPALANLKKYIYGLVHRRKGKAEEPNPSSPTGKRSNSLNIVEM